MESCGVSKSVALQLVVIHFHHHTRLNRDPAVVLAARPTAWATGSPRGLIKTRFGLQVHETAEDLDTVDMRESGAVANEVKVTNLVVHPE